jgi:phospholipid transport system substrate-binding protein
MSSFRFVAAFGLLLLAVPFASDSSRAAEAGAASFITEFGNKMLGLVQAEHNSPAELEQKMRPLVLDAFDAPRIARFALGRYWRGMSEGDRNQFTQVFEDYVVHVYSARFSGYRGERFVVTGAQPQATSGAQVTSTITQPEGGSPIRLNWQLVRASDRYKIVDVSVEGISQALTYRDEFGSFIERHDGRVSDLIAELREKAKA